VLELFLLPELFDDLPLPPPPFLPAANAVPDIMKTITSANSADPIRAILLASCLIIGPDFPKFARYCESEARVRCGLEYTSRLQSILPLEHWIDGVEVRARSPPVGMSDRGAIAEGA
jgi:hypothetical protein